MRRRCKVLQCYNKCSIITMPTLQRRWDDLTDESLRVATLVGLASIPFTVVLSGESEPHAIAGAPLLFAGLIVGYVYGKRPTASRRADRRAGAVASIGVVLWQLSYLTSIVRTLSLEIAVVVTALTPVVAAVGVGLSLLVVMVGATVAEWIVVNGPRIRDASN